MVLLLVVQDLCGFLCAFSTCCSVAINLIRVFLTKGLSFGRYQDRCEFASNVEYRKDLTYK